MKNTIACTPIKINDKRLTPDLRRSRNGSTMEFYRPDNRSLQSKDADLIIQAPRKELYAELIDNEWYWVNDCPECNGKEPEWAYVKCDKHNVCTTCKTPRSELTDTPWGHKEGFECKPCYDIRWEEEKRIALEEFAAAHHEEWNFCNNDEVVCPHCDLSYDPAEPHEGNEICDRCGGEYVIELEHSVTYSTAIKGERVTA